MKFRNALLAVVGTSLGLAAMDASAVVEPIVVSEVDAGGSAATYGFDWFELKNTSGSSVDMTGWKMDDSSAAFSTAVLLHDINGSGITLAAGERIVMIDDENIAAVIGSVSGATAASGSGGTNSIGNTAWDTYLKQQFVNYWFNGNEPAGVRFGFFGGSGIGLGSSGDAVNIFNSSGTSVVGVSFGALTTGYTFDNSAGASGAISTLSAVGTNGAFTALNGTEVGSPGDVTPVPVPAAAWLLMSGVGVLGAMRRRRKAD